jgi:hypothetical protein
LKEAYMRKSVLFGALVVCALMVFSSSVVLAADNWVGTWKQNVTKSTYSPGPGPKSLILKFEATPAGTKLTADGVDGDGKPMHSGWTSKLDGKEVPWDGDNPNADMAAPKKVDDNTYTNAWKKAGKATINSKAVVSADGKTLTITQTGKNAKGEAVNITAVYEKQ